METRKIKSRLNSTNKVWGKPKVRKKLIKMFLIPPKECSQELLLSCKFGDYDIIYECGKLISENL